MKKATNVIWFIFFGMIPCAIHYAIGALLCCTIIFFPVGKSFFRLARLEAFPFNKVTDLRTDEPRVRDILWVLLFGGLISLFYLLLAFVLCITIIGIPFAKQCVKIAKFAFAPLGSDAYDEDMSPINHNPA